MILGIDEVGRGAWAGPVAVGAVAIEPDAVSGLADSKLLSKKKRILLTKQIRREAAWAGVGWVSARKIDEIGMSAALKLAARRATAGIPADTYDIIIDGTIRLLEGANVTTLKKADQLVPAVSAASIIAKVARDNYMAALGAAFSDYNFDAHVGYGTAAHQAALIANGPSPLHRMSFAPMSALAGGIATPQSARVTDGQKAEAKAAAYLRTQGFRVIERNWKTKRCEIDIIAEKEQTIYFVEVKYRQNTRQGAGFEYITLQKQRQMSFAADAWRSTQKWAGEVRLAAVQVSGSDFTVTGFETEIHEVRARRAQTRQFGS